MGMRRRWALLVIGIPIYTVALMVLMTIAVEALEQTEWADLAPHQFVLHIVEIIGDGDWWVTAGVPAASIVGSQIVFLVPVFSKRPPRDERSRPLLLSLVIGAAIAAMLTFALLLGVGEFIETVLEASLDLDDALATTLLVATVLGSWVFWSAILLIFSRSIWADRALGRLVGLLLGGTLLEVLVVLPLDIMVRRRTDCYCFAGTFFALCLAVIATLWLAGPGVVIALMSKKHRLWRETHCERCGYAKGPSPGAKCPECSYAWVG